MRKKYVRIKAPEEFDKWISERTKNIRRVVHTEMKLKDVKVTKMEAMRILSDTNGVEIPDEALKKLRRRLGYKKC